MAIILDDADFQCLVRGGILTIKWFPFFKLRFKLSSNISHSQMHTMVNRADDKLEEAFKPHLKTLR